MQILGKLDWSAIPLSEPIPIIASAVVAVAITGTLIWVWAKGYWPYLWREWITSVDHKRIGAMYVILAVVMLVRGFSDAILMRSQQALAYHGPGYLPPEHYNQVFSAHGTIMIFFGGMPFMIGLMNYAVPLQLGVRDVPARRAPDARQRPGRLRPRCSSRSPVPPGDPDRGAPAAGGHGAQSDQRTEPGV